MSEADEIKELLKDFHRVSGFRVSIHDSEFHEIISFPEQLTDFCKAIQRHPEQKRKCLTNDIYAFQRAQQAGEAYVYHCHCGLIESVTPIYHFGVLAGYLMIGQIMDQGAGEQVYALSYKLFESPGKARKIIAEIPCAEKETITAYIHLMTVVAEYITRTNKLRSRNRTLASLTKEYLDLNYTKRLSLGLLCRRFDCCKSTLMTSFKKEYSMTVNEYLTEVRLSVAAMLLKKSQKSVKEIAAECGFHDQNYFSRVFTKRTHCPPTKFRDNDNIKFISKKPLGE